MSENACVTPNEVCGNMPDPTTWTSPHPECVMKQDPWLDIGTNQRGNTHPSASSSTSPVYGTNYIEYYKCTNTHTQHCQAKEEEGLLRTFKQEDIFRKVLLSGETKGGSDLTSHRRESEGHRWRNGHAYGTVSHIHVHMLISDTYTHLANTVKVLCAALKIAISLSLYLFADIRIMGMFCIHVVFPSAVSTRNPLCFIKGCCGLSDKTGKGTWFNFPLSRLSWHSQIMWW